MYAPHQSSVDFLAYLLTMAIPLEVFDCLWKRITIVVNVLHSHWVWGILESKLVEFLVLPAPFHAWSEIHAYMVSKATFFMVGHCDGLHLGKNLSTFFFSKQ